MAHGDDEGTLGEVGDGPEPTNLTKMAGGPESEGEVRGGRGRLRGVARKSGRLPRRSRRWPASARVRPARSCFGARGRKMTGSWAAQ